ncbi:MAG: hypothetical protein AAGC67_04055, partial [Myxococcota bacterium]
MRDPSDGGAPAMTLRIAGRAAFAKVLVVRIAVLTVACVVGCATLPGPARAPSDPLFRVERLGPILTPDSHPEAGHNIMGPALVRVPSWVENPLGRYYLYFA